MLVLTHLVRNPLRAGSARVGWLAGICLLAVGLPVLADGPPPPCEDPCSAGCPAYGSYCCENFASSCCDPAVDCNNNGVEDSCELAACPPGDCNHNNTLDDCDVAASTPLNCEYERFVYDALGRRIARIRTGCAGAQQETRYYYDGQNVLVETDETGTAERYFVNGAQYIDERVLMHDYDVGADAFYIERELHTVAGLAWNPAWGMMEKYAYDAYGKVRATDRPYVLDDDPDTESNYGNPYYLTGRRLDHVDDTAASSPRQLYHYRARAYDPVHGRFVQRDPIGYAGGGMSLYEYVMSSPERLVDPQGQMPGLITGGYRWVAAMVKYLYGDSSPWHRDGWASDIKVMDGYPLLVNNLKAKARTDGFKETHSMKCGQSAHGRFHDSFLFSMWNNVAVAPLGEFYVYAYAVCTYTVDCENARCQCGLKYNCDVEYQVRDPFDYETASTTGSWLVKQMTPPLLKTMINRLLYDGEGTNDVNPFMIYVDWKGKIKGQVCTVVDAYDMEPSEDDLK